MSSPAENAQQFFRSGHLCGESVLRAVAEAAKIDSPLIPGVATGLCSGLSRTCGPCGAVMGAVIAVNLVHGRSTPDKSQESKDQLEDCYGRVQEIVDAFTGKFGSINCFDLTGCDFRTAEGQKRFDELGRIENCMGYVAFAVERALEALED